ncbi:hypothetical protein [Tenuibacillus multivorans]|uniref:HMA domain-containing protein n=1 Tax=Tenuibacillus multivorans TaxID=237069 RepID=A0A1H0CKM6_9BACI|nr:hypothetical protein [Tenuibacillus multivorans]GEL76258.1 hypothetical protein TMU01_04930 [Tenuibacillus multivorans]SDN58426.1 hypothetical protein SAMN05216498_2576 [Tenuibacillus multivorans]
MKEITMLIKEANSEMDIQEIEYVLNDLGGVERVLIDPDDGELKIEYNDQQISKERIAITLQQHDFHIM